MTGIDLEAAVLADVADRLVENREVPQPQKVHLEQAGQLDARAVPLRNDVILSGDRLQRDVIDQRLVGDDDAGGVGPRTAGQALEPDGDVDHFVDLRVGVVGLLQVGALFDRVLQPDVQRVRHHLGDVVDADERN